MSLSLSLATYFIIWWVVLFAVLPFGVRTQAEAGDVVPGTPESAPARQQILKTFLITTLVASAVFALVRWLYVTPGARLWINDLLQKWIGVALFPA